jgi:hypothetical protein
MSASRILIDVGSTIIKYFRLDPDGDISDGGYYDRDYDQVVSEQVTAILRYELDWREGRDAVRLCSSANGGLSVGILGYTDRFSATWAKKAAFNAGANVLWATDLSGLGKSSIVPVDLFVIAGGATDSPIERQVKWLCQSAEIDVQSETVVFAGNPKLFEVVPNSWPNAVIAGNVIGDDMRWQGDSLSQVLREVYLKDLVNHKGISGLQRFSEVAILPTPSVVFESYKAILNGESGPHLPAPLMLLDIGGATTDVFYGSELFADTVSNQPRPETNRYVFAHLGVSTSKNSLLEQLSINDRLGDFLRMLYPDDAERRYLALREGVTGWVTSEFLAEACCFLALDECTKGLPGEQNMELARVLSVVITGGASQMCAVERLQRIVHLCGARQAKAYLDQDYKIWIEGMKRLNPLTKGNLNASY